MGLPTGTFELGPAQAQLHLHTTKAGLGARLAHDLVLEASSWSGTLHLAEHLGDSDVEVSVETASLQVVDSSGGVRPVSEDDKLEIHGNLTGAKGLQADDHPAITFRSTSVRGELPSLSVSGDLTIVGVTLPVSLSVSVDEPEEGEEGDITLEAHATVVQSDYGITPYSAMFGAIRVADAVEIAIRAPLHLT